MRAASHGTAQRAGEIEAHDLRLQAQAAAATPHELADLRGRIRAVDEDAVLVPETGRRILVAGVRAEPVPPVRADDQASRALVELHVMQLEAGKIKTVGSVAHQQGIQTAGAHQLAQAVASGSIGRVHARFLCREGREGCAGGRGTFLKKGPPSPRTPRPFQKLLFRPVWQVPVFERRQEIPAPVHETRKPDSCAGYKGNMSSQHPARKVEQKTGAHRRPGNTGRRLYGRPCRTSER